MKKMDTLIAIWQMRRWHIEKKSVGRLRLHVSEQNMFRCGVNCNMITLFFVQDTVLQVMVIYEIL